MDFEHIVDQLEGLYEPDEARLFLTSCQELLGGKTPADLIREGRASEVLILVGQLRDGIFC